MESPSINDLSIGIDIGGTFTDFVVHHLDAGTIETFKLISSPQDPAETVLKGLERILGNLDSPQAQRADIIHGSTVATNALLERKGARTALIATRGFGDVLQIGRQNRPELYDFNADPPPQLVPPELRFEVDERVTAQGMVLYALDPKQIEDLIPSLLDQEVQSVAISLVFSFLYPNHENQIARRLRSAGFLVSPSSEVLPEYREYERTSTTVVNAYVSPILDRYLAGLEDRLGGSNRLRVMQSNGGAISVTEARRNGVRCILSGPAGGVVGSQYVAKLALTPLSKGEGTRVGELQVITFDMGGTSTDVSLIDGTPQVTAEAAVGGCPIHIPVLDIHTIGAGGGSIARLDAGGALRVGPQSAGADPGPACYGKGDLPTVTDANLVLGRLLAEHFLGGQMPLVEERAYGAISSLSKQMDLTVQQAALGIVQVANAHMERALRVISVERGHDPRRFTLLSFGGAGGLHAADLARSLGIAHVLVPPLASTLSAFGMLAADVVKDYTQTVMLPGSSPLAEIETRIQPLVLCGLSDLDQEGILPDRQTIERLIDIRYAGQSYELTIPFSQTVILDFHDLHRRAYGYARPEAPLEIVNLRVRAIGKVETPILSYLGEGESDSAGALLDRRRVTFPSGDVNTPFYRGEALRPGNRLKGPLVVVRSDTTILLGLTDAASVDPYGNLMITIGKP
jgi:N-methylhydantoinase A